MKRLAGTWLAAGWLVLAGAAHAHKASDAYLQLRVESEAVELRLDVALRDLDVALDLDRDGDGLLRWGEIETAWPAIETLLRAGVQVGGCALTPTGRGLERRSDGAYAVLTQRGACTLREPPAIRYTLLGDVDPTHRGIARIERPGAAPVVSVLDPARPRTLDAAQPSSEATPIGLLREGVVHILSGYDHLLFLLCLLLPAVMRRAPAGDSATPRWRPVERMSDALLPVLGIVSAFTLAHSITLGLAALRWVELPARLIEPAIALTVVLAALDNLVPIFRGRRVAIAFGFGLVHGFGFANVLGELQLAPGAFAWALLQFNLGLELGQAGIVLLAVAALYLARRHPRYPAWVIGGGSLAAIAVGVVWFAQRAVDVGEAVAAAPRPTFVYNQVSTYKSEKGTMVMTPRTSSFFQEV